MRFLVGTPPAHFYIHKTVLCDMSSLFSTASSSGSSTESKESFNELPKDDPKIFAVFVKTLYSNTYEVLGFANASHNKQKAQQIEIIKLLDLAERLKCSKLHLCLTEAFCESTLMCKFLPNADTFALHYDKSERDGQFRKFLLGSWINTTCAHYQNDSVQQTVKNRPELAMELILGLAQRVDELLQN